MSRGAATLVAIPLPPPFLLPRSILRSQASTIQKRSFGIKSTDGPRHDRFHPKSLLASQASANKRRELADTLPLRTGAMAIKKGMTAVYDENGKRVPCTVLQFDRNQVVSHKTVKKNGYFAVCVGSGTVHEKNVSKPMLGHYSVQGVSPKRHLHEFRVKDQSGLLPVGELIPATWFHPGQFIDTRSNCKGKGWQGVMKRWGMHGQDRSHGVSKTHRSMGSAGQGQGGGSRVYPGKKMAGNMGGQRNTVQNVKVLQSDAEQGLLVVQGAVSGPKGCIVMVQDALKKSWPEVPSITINPSQIEDAKTEMAAPASA
ncbi:50S ribosomal protein L3 [Cyphellophora europaea CBS 101466]|uniref:Large ribosomal subunit protein uL3m n=1 Tax=Cyphellophora europaea (strain CBS 101466) TaxID=1220924 RepID=W2SCK5_CYPE1|nr:50S ribosomal protein L3 [Cyphellophora europaea CBS 101466]ETN45664.1 50S ribosomal protein L3 [Cyphellophora europaea CBS 101466]